MGKPHWSGQRWGAWPIGWSEAATRDNLNVGERATLEALALAAKFETGAIEESRARLAATVGVNPRTVDRAIDGDKRKGRPGLERLGYVEVIDRGGGRGQCMRGRLRIPGHMTGQSVDDSPVNSTDKPRSDGADTPVKTAVKAGHVTGGNNRETKGTEQNKGPAAGDVLAALAEAGIREPARSRLAALPLLTPKMVRDCADRCRREGKRGGLLIEELEAAHAEQVKQTETMNRRERAAAWWADLSEDERRRWADRVRAENRNTAPDDHESMPVWAWKLKQAEDNTCD